MKYRKKPVVIEFAKDQCEIFPEDSDMGMFLRDVIKTSEVKAIPLDRIKEAREEIKSISEVIHDGQNHYYKDCHEIKKEVLEILDRLVESEG